MTESSRIFYLANSIIGVGILTMPYCFKQCGIVLGVVALWLVGLLTKTVCHHLVKAALLARRRNYEMLAYETFGLAGKWMVEICIIGYLMGCAVAFFVVIGDLMPQILGNTFGFDSSPLWIRNLVMISSACGIAYPLSLLRDIQSLGGICTASIGFYFLLVFKILLEAAPKVSEHSKYSEMEIWRSSGFLIVVPILTMAQSCQTQVFEVYESLHEPSLKTMDRIVSRAIDLCTFVYAATGILGYVAFGNSASGNAILDLQPSMFTQVIKFGFVMSVLLSFPLLVFPCRSSIYSMLFGRVTVSPYDPNGNESIPEFRFKAMTAFIIGSTLLVGLAVPNIEFVLGLVGATIGTVVCVILPSICLLQVTDVDKSSKDRPKAQIVLLIGLTILLFGTYYSIYPEGSKVDISLANDIPSFVKDDEVIKLMEKVQPEIEQAKILNKGIIGESPTGDKRVEPALPFESDGGAPVETKEEEDKEVEEIIKEETKNEERIEREEEDKEVEEIIKEETKNEERVESVVNEPEIDGNAEKKLMVKFENLKEEPINKERDIAKSEYKKVRISPGEYQPNKEIEKANKFIPKGRKVLNKNLNLIIPKKIHNELSNIEEKWIIAKEEKSNAVKKRTRENQEKVNPKYTLESAGKDGVHLNIMNNKVNDEDNPRGNIESLQKSAYLATKKDGEENRSNLIQEESKQESINGGGRDILSLDKADASINAIQQPALGEKAINNSVLKEDSVQSNPVKRQVRVTESVHYNTTVIQHLNVVPEKEV